jgi:hypothetical protein
MMDAGFCAAETTAGTGVSRPVALCVLVVVFLFGGWVGRCSVLMETRVRRQHLEETVAKIVQGVVAGVVVGLGTSKDRRSPPRTRLTTTDAGTIGVEDGIAGPATQSAHAAPTPSRVGSNSHSPSQTPSASSRRTHDERRSIDLARARARAEAASAEQTMKRAEAVVAAAAAAARASRPVSQTRDPLPPDDDSEEEDETVLSPSRVESVNDSGNDAHGNDSGNDARGPHHAINDAPIEMDVDASMEDAFWPEDSEEEVCTVEEDGETAETAMPASYSVAASDCLTASKPMCAEPTPSEPSGDTTEPVIMVQDQVDKEYFSVGDPPVEVASGTLRGVDVQLYTLVDETKQHELETAPASFAGEATPTPTGGQTTFEVEPEKEKEPETVVETTPAPDTVVESAPESPTRAAAVAAHEQQRQLEIDRQRNTAKAAKKQARGERLVTERVAAHRKDILQAELRAREMASARNEASEFLENSGVHALCAAGCLGFALLKLGSLAVTQSELAEMADSKIENAYKKALAQNHPDRSAARRDDVQSAARCEETFKLLQAAHARWGEMGKPVGNMAEMRARSVFPQAGAGVSFASTNQAGYAKQDEFNASRRQGSPGFSSSQAAQAAGNGTTRSWRPGEASSASGGPHNASGSASAASDYRDAFRERARRSAAAAADALRREEERVAAELAAERERENMFMAAEARERAREETLAAAAAADAAFASGANDAERMRSPVRKARRPPTREEREREMERNMDKL